MNRSDEDRFFLIYFLSSFIHAPSFQGKDVCLAEWRFQGSLLASSRAQKTHGRKAESCVQCSKLRHEDAAFVRRLGMMQSAGERMSWLNDPNWRDRFLIRFKQPPSQQLMEFIKTEIAWAVQRERDRLQSRTPLPLPKG